MRGDFDDKKDVFVRAIELEEGGSEDDVDDVEAGSLPLRREARLHAVKTSLSVALAVLAQFLGIAEVGTSIDANIESG